LENWKRLIDWKTGIKGWESAINGLIPGEWSGSQTKLAGQKSINNESKGVANDYSDSKRKRQVR
jgi:hypothetical protein